MGWLMPCIWFDVAGRRLWKAPPRSVVGRRMVGSEAGVCALRDVTGEWRWIKGEGRTAGTV